MQWYGTNEGNTRGSRLCRPSLFVCWRFKNIFNLFSTRSRVTLFSFYLLKIYFILCFLFFISLITTTKMQHYFNDITKFSLVTKGCAAFTVLLQHWVILGRSILARQTSQMFNRTAVWALAGLHQTSTTFWWSHAFCFGGMLWIVLAFTFRCN